MLVIRVWHAGYIFSKYKINSPFKNLVLFNIKGLTCWLYIFSNTHQNIYIKSSCTLPVTWVSRLEKHYSRLTQSNDLWFPKHKVLFLAFASVIPPHPPNVLAFLSHLAAPTCLQDSEWASCSLTPTEYVPPLCSHNPGTSLYHNIDHQVDPYFCLRPGNIAYFTAQYLAWSRSSGSHN